MNKANGVFWKEPDTNAKLGEYRIGVNSCVTEHGTLEECLSQLDLLFHTHVPKDTINEVRQALKTHCIVRIPNGFKEQITEHDVMIWHLTPGQSREEFFSKSHCEKVLPYYDSTRPNGPSASILYNNGCEPDPLFNDWEIL